MEDGRSALKMLTGKPTGKIPQGRSRRRWEDNIRMDLEEIGNNAGNCVDSAQGGDYWRAFVYVALNLQVPSAMDLVSQVVIYFILFEIQKIKRDLNDRQGLKKTPKHFKWF